MSSAGTAYIDVEAKADSLASDIEAAVSAVDTQTVDVEAVADTTAAQADIDAIEGGTTDVVVDADTSEAESEIESIPDPEPEEITVEANTEQAQQSIDDLSGSVQDLFSGLGGSGGLMEGFAGAATGMGVASGAAATGGVMLLGAGIDDVVGSFGEAQAVAAETTSMLDSMGSGAVTTSEHIADLSQSIMEYSGFSDEAVQAGANTLLMFENINSQPVFDRALNDAADMARRLGTDVPSAARMLGIALQDPESGMNRLRRAGVILSDSQKATITAMMETGDVAGAQQIIFDALEGKIGNLAEAYGNTLPGEIDKTNEAIDGHKEKIGAALAPAYESALEAIDWFLQGQEAFVSGLSYARDSVEDFFGVADDSAKNFGDMIPGSMGQAENAIDDTAGAAEELAQAMSDLSTEIDDYLGGLFDVPDAQQNLRQSFSELNDAITTGTWDDQADAMQNVVESTAQLIDAQNQAGGSQSQMDNTIKSAVKQLHSMQAQGLLTADQVADLTTEITGIPHVSSTQFQTPGLLPAISNSEKYAEKAKQIDKMNPSTSFTAPGLSGVYGTTANYRAEMDRIDERTVTTYFKRVDFAGGPISKNAAGTESAMPGLSLVGEEGPELVVFGGGEKVLTASQTSAALAGMSSAAPIVVNVHGTATAADGQAVVDALRRWQQRNGPVPVKVSA